MIIIIIIILLRCKLAGEYGQMYPACKSRSFSAPSFDFRSGDALNSLLLSALSKGIKIISAHRVDQMCQILQWIYNQKRSSDCKLFLTLAIAIQAMFDFFSLNKKIMLWSRCMCIEGDGGLSTRDYHDNAFFRKYCSQHIKAKVQYCCE